MLAETIGLFAKNNPALSGQRLWSLSNDDRGQPMAEDNFYWHFRVVCDIYKLAGTMEGPQSSKIKFC